MTEAPLGAARPSERDGVRGMLASNRTFGRRGGRIDAVFLHANGFHGGVYGPALSLVGQGARVAAPDLRGFGLNQAPHDPAALTSWDVFVSDVVAYLDAMNARDLVLAGHSLGAVVALCVAAQRPERIKALALFEPVLLPALVYRLMRSARVRSAFAKRASLPRGAARRRPAFPDRQTARASYTGRGPFRTWPDAALDAYLADGLIVSPDALDGAPDRFRLAAAPAWEQAVYAAQSHNPWRAWRALTVPARVYLGERQSTVAPAQERALRRGRPQTQVERVAGASHFLPIEHPDLVAATLLDLING